MPLDYPFAKRPHVPPPQANLHILARSRSPTRDHARQLDPLLRNLSPATTLRACLLQPDDMEAPNADALITSLHLASAPQRALGAKAASICLDLRAWTREIEAWQWPGTFHLPQAQEGEYWGSLPARTVQAYEQRADDIAQRLDGVDVEELKDYVLNSHYRINSRPPSRSDAFGEAVAEDLKKLDDFTVVVTATILQALPFLSKLHQLLDIWTIRLVILRSAPTYLRDLQRARIELDCGWAAIATSSSSRSPNEPSLDRHMMERLTATIQNQLGSLGRRLDRFLDDLEGRDDCVPDTWVDDFELLESAYGAWLVQAERKVLENECQKLRTQPGSELTTQSSPPSIIAPSTLVTVSETEDPDSDDDAVRRPSQEVQSGDQSPWLAQIGWQSNEHVDDAATTDSGRARELQELQASMTWSALPGRSISQPTSIVVAPGTTYPRSNSVTAAASQRSVSGGPSPVNGDLERGSLARKQAAFLNVGIEQNERLNLSKSPVRPFEHASNAFTRLFRKDWTPEKVKPKRHVSNKWRSGASAVPEYRKTFSPTSLVSSHSNSVSVSSSIQSEAGSTKISVNGPDQATVGQDQSIVDQTSPRDRDAENREEPEFHAHDGRRAGRSARANVMPETYKPTGPDSPFHSPFAADSPQDWPLASPADSTPPACTSQQKAPQSTGPIFKAPAYDAAENKTLTAPIETDVFDRMFVQSLPQNSEDRPNSATILERRHSHWNIGRRRLAPLSRSHKPPTPSREYLDLVSIRKPRALPASRPRSEPDSSTVTHIETSFPLPDFSLLHASKKRSPRPESAQTDTPRVQVPATHVEAEPVHEAFQVKRASVASIELFSRAELKSIDVPKPRHNGISPRITPPRTPPTRSRQPSLVNEDNARALEKAAEANVSSLPTPPVGHFTSTDITDPPCTDGAENQPLEHGPEPHTDDFAPLNAVIRKRRVKNDAMNETTAPQPSGSPELRPDADKFDRRVSGVLDSLSAPIKFKPRPGAETPVPRHSPVLGRRRARGPAMKVPSRNGDLTIVPADPWPKKPSSASEPEVKLYHLTQSDCDDPIKLFVRIVGEGEQRVLVRVGGGWTDLADYLIGFAQHHGSRTVSEGNFEVQTVTGAARLRKASGTADFSRAKSPVTPMSAGVRPDSSDGDSEISGKPPPFDARTNGVSLVPKKTAASTQNSTPKSTSPSSRPSTATLSRPSSRQNTGEVGLSGPCSASKRAGLPEHKAKWVDGMIERAKQASAEKSKEDKEKYLSEIGKAGGTRRLYFRSPSGTAGAAEELKP